MRRGQWVFTWLLTLLLAASLGACDDGEGASNDLDSPDNAQAQDTSDAEVDADLNLDQDQDVQLDQAVEPDQDIESDTGADNDLMEDGGPDQALDSEEDLSPLDEDGLPRRNFTVQRPEIDTSNEYVIELERWEIPNNGTDPMVTTENLQAAFDWAHGQGYGRVVLPAGEYLVGVEGSDIYQAGVEIEGDTELVFAEGAVLRMAPNDKWNYCVLMLNGDNITVRDGEIVGDRDEHVFTPSSNGGTAHDEGHGICAWYNNRVLIQNMELRALTGDGVLVLESNDVSLIENNVHNNRRQGFSIVGGVRVEVLDNEIHHINGTAPQFGVDIEGAGRLDKDILIQNNSFHHNAGGDVVNASGLNVYILDNIMEQGEGSQYTDGPIVSWHKTHNIIARNTITMVDGSANGRLGYIQYSGGGEKGHNEVTYVHENVCNSCGIYMYKSADADVRRNQLLGYFVAFSEFSNLTLIDNLVTYSPDHPNLRYCWDYRFKEATGYAEGNLIEGNPHEIPLSQTEPYTLQCVLDGW